MGPFTAADGKKARWRYCYELVATRKPGDEITRMEVMEAAGCDEQQAIAAMREAKKHLEFDRQRTVRLVSKFGWIVLDAAGNLSETDRRSRKAARAVTRAARILAATPREELSQIDRARSDYLERQLLSARGIYERTSASFAELQRSSAQRSAKGLPSAAASQGSA